MAPGLEQISQLVKFIFVFHFLSGEFPKKLHKNNNI